MKPSSDFKQQLLQDGLFEVIEADRFDSDVSSAANDVVAVVYIETFGRLRRKNIFRGLHDNWQAIDDDAFGYQRVTNCAEANGALVIIAVSGNINDLSAAGKLSVELLVAE